MIPGAGSGGVMRGVSKRIAKWSVASAVVVLLAQPTFAAAKTQARDNPFGSLIRRIIVRVLGTIDVSFPPG